MPKPFILLAIVLALQGIAFLIAIPLWIPSWSLFPWIAAAFAYLLAGYFTFRLLSHVNGKMKFKMETFPRRISLGVMTVLMAGWLIFAGLVTAFLADGGLFPPVYITQYEFSDPDTAIYVYDGSFLDPQTDLYVRAGTWPWLNRIAIVYGRLWDEDPVKEGDWVVWPSFRYNLVTAQSSE